MRPLIGIPCFPLLRAGSLRPHYGLGRAYVQAVERAGGIPLLIPPQAGDAAPREIVTRIDGLLLPGGGDVDPALYGEERSPACGEPEPERDALEIPLTRLALERGVPIFGICRGMQVLNVAVGGTLYQDIAAQRPKSPPHETHDYEGPRDVRSHAISIRPGSAVERIMGATRHDVNSFHHQAIQRPGEGVEIIAWADDGIAEAMVLPAHPFALAVQFHPEELAPADPASQRLFDAFVRACAERMRGEMAAPLAATAR